MKLNKIAVALLATAATAATAGVTVSPVLLGYHYLDEAQSGHKKILNTHKHLLDTTAADSASGNKVSSAKDAGVALDSNLYTGAALGVELTPSTQLQVEYGVTSTDAKRSDASAKLHAGRFDAQQETISGNFLIGTEQFTGHNPNSKFKPYVLVGAGQSKIKVENKDAYTVDAAAGKGMTKATNEGWYYPAGYQVTSSTDTIGNVGVGARYLVNDALALRGEVRGIHNFDNDWWEGLALAGLEVTLGGRMGPKAAAPAKVEPQPYTPPVKVEPVTPPPAVVTPPPVIEQPAETASIDSDMDGVPDEYDVCPNTPRNHVVDERGCTLMEETSRVIPLEKELRVFFDNDKTVIKQQYVREIEELAGIMHQLPNRSVTIEGHASKVGSAKYNQRLSEARARAVASVLTNRFGVAANRLNTVGYGYDRPIAPNNTEEGRAQNRRVFAIIQGETTKTTSVPKTKDAQ